MSDTLRITLSSNAGLISEYKGTKLLSDGIYEEDGHPFSGLGSERKRLLIGGLPPYDGIDCLLFTHNHPDHFDERLTLDFLKNNAVKSVFIPDDAKLRGGPLLSYVKKRGIPCVLLSKKTEHVVFRIGEDVKLRSFAVPHLDPKYRDVPHCCLLVSFGNKNVLFTADADYTAETFSFLGDIELKAVFVNPLFFGALRRGKFFKGSFNTEKICVYHVPFPEDDFMHIRSMLKKDSEAWPSGAPEAVILDSPYQSVEL